MRALSAKATLAISSGSASRGNSGGSSFFVCGHRWRGRTPPNGLRPGGLQVTPGALPGSELWQGANLPTELTQGDRIKVNINQTQQKAILTWDTFHVGARTDLTFNQNGNRDWVVLNRVLATDAQPSQILGTLKADAARSAWRAGISISAPISLPRWNSRLQDVQSGSKPGVR